MKRRQRTRPGAAERSSGRTPRGAGQLRIIGGEWRGRRLRFPELPGLRPTGDRIRETLFNWLAPQLPGARCLDLFAGSGALGLEALSRGAAHCDFVDSSEDAVAALRGHLETLAAGDRATVVCADALEFLATAREPYDIVFVDPPFAAALTGPGVTALLDSGAAAPGARIYIEHDAGDTPDLPPALVPLREKRNGNVSYRLLEAAAVRS